MVGFFTLFLLSITRNELGLRKSEGQRSEAERAQN